MNFIEKTKGQWDRIYQHFEIDPTTGNKHRECPICQKKKFRMHNRHGFGDWICVCGAGQGIKLINLVTGLDFKEIYRQIARLLNIENDRPVQVKTNEKLNRAVNKFKQSQALSQDNQGGRYLNNRGIWVLPRGGAKYCESVYDYDLKRNLCGMIAIASNEYREAVFFHVTYLKNDHKAQIETQKKMYALQEYSGPVSIKLFNHQTTLGIAEGIETALAVNQQFKCPTWATVNASLMKKFKAPQGVDHLIIWADNDRGGTGLAAAFECGRSNIYANNSVSKVTVKWTMDRGDFNDYLKEPSQINEMILTK